jgi:hypothetical protein
VATVVLSGAAAHALLAACCATFDSDFAAIAWDEIAGFDLIGVAANQLPG